VNVLPARLGVATLGLLFGALACAEAVVLALSYGVTFDVLLVPTLLGALVAVFIAASVYVYARTLVRELDAVVEASQAKPVRLSFRESEALSAALRRPATLAPPPKPVPAGLSSAEEAVALRVRFIASMGHDLRSPLNAMLGFADLLLLDPQASWTPSQKKSLSILRERTLDLLSLIDGMIDWARLEAGELVPAKQVCDAATLITRAVERAQEHSGARGLRVSLSLSPDLGAITVDSDQFVRALLGLMDHGTRADKGPTLTVTATRHSSQVRIEVADPSLVFREDDQAHLFEAFRPSFAPSGRRIAGLRLGTAVARSLMRAQGGDVWFERRPERGTTFVLTVPAA
jgi:signal transduction histidine kinase